MHKRILSICIIFVLSLAVSSKYTVADEVEKDSISNDFHAVKMIYDNYERKEKGWYVGEMKIKEKKLLSLFHSVLPYDFSLKVTTNPFARVSYELNMPMSSQEKEASEKMDEVLASIIDEKMNLKKKIVVIHDWIIKNTSYHEKPSDDKINVHSLTGPMLYGVGVCDGYAKTFMAMCQKVDIPCLVIISEEINHAWNMVYDGKEWKMVDTTWDDPVPNVPGRALRTHLLFPIDEFENKYQFDLSGETTLSKEEYLLFANYFYEEKLKDPFLGLSNEYVEMIVKEKKDVQIIEEFVLKLILFFIMKEDVRFHEMIDFLVTSSYPYKIE